jgi:hypothetical protein
MNVRCIPLLRDIVLQGTCTLTSSPAVQCSRSAPSMRWLRGGVRFIIKRGRTSRPLAPQAHATAWRNGGGVMLFIIEQIRHTQAPQALRGNLWHRRTCTEVMLERVRCRYCAGADPVAQMSTRKYSPSILCGHSGCPPQFERTLMRSNHRTTWPMR